MSSTLDRVKGKINQSEFEDLCRAFADAGDEDAIIAAIDKNSGPPLNPIPYDDLPEGSKHWFRVRMRAACDLLGLEITS